MKYLIVSDIHGSLPPLQQVLNYFERMEMDILIILGDILNYGPRNGIPEGLNPIGIAERLNAMSSKIIAIRGNCDSEVDQMLLHFPIMADYTFIVDNGVRIFLTHGHVYNEQNLPNIPCDALIYGHTHRQKLEMNNRTVVCNTGSITFPKDGNPPTFATYSDGTLRMHHINGSIIKEIKIK
jgi:putative phosphoesterase